MESRRSNLGCTIEPPCRVDLGLRDDANFSPPVVLHGGMKRDAQSVDDRVSVLGGESVDAARSVREALGLLGSAPRQRPTVRGSTLEPDDSLRLQRVEGDPVRRCGDLRPARSMASRVAGSRLSS